ncbi:MAG: flippase-like domain-containing protein [Bacteroidales bacterium]|nr:flippase-like domain-containing protein [Bacteroidales bacterium]
MKDKIKDIVKLILFLCLGVFFVWFSVKDLTAEQRAEIWKNIQYVFVSHKWIYLLICALIGYVSVWLRGIRSVLMINPLGYKMRYSSAYHSVCICYLANMAIPRLGEILRCTVLQKYEKVPFQKSLGTVVTERVIDVLICGLMFLFALVLESDKIIQILTGNHVGANIMHMLSGWGKYVILLALLLMCVIIYLLRRRIARFGIVQKMKKILMEFWEGMLSIRKISQPLLFVIYSLLIWLCYYFMFFFALFAFPEVMSLGSDIWLLSLSAVVIGTVGFAIAQGGLGAYPWLISIVMALYGISSEVGLALGWVVWSTESVLYLLIGIISLVIISLKK